MLLKKQGGGRIRAAPLSYEEGVETGGLTARWEINVYVYHSKSTGYQKLLLSNNLSPAFD